MLYRRFAARMRAWYEMWSSVVCKNRYEYRCSGFQSGFSYHSRSFCSLVSQLPPCKAVEVKSQLLQLQSMSSQGDFTDLRDNPHQLLLEL